MRGGDPVAFAGGSTLKEPRKRIFSSGLRATRAGATAACASFGVCKRLQQYSPLVFHCSFLSRFPPLELRLTDLRLFFVWRERSDCWKHLGCCRYPCFIWSLQTTPTILSAGVPLFLSFPLSTIGVASNRLAIVLCVEGEKRLLETRIWRPPMRRTPLHANETDSSATFRDPSCKRDSLLFRSILLSNKGLASLSTSYNPLPGESGRELTALNLLETTGIWNYWLLLASRAGHLRQTTTTVHSSAVPLCCSAVEFSPSFGQGQRAVYSAKRPTLSVEEREPAAGQCIWSI